MTPTSAPDLPDIDKVLQMTKDMELISDFLTNGRFVGDRVYVSIEHLAECIRNTRPQSEASALATPVGWRPPSSDPSAIQVHVVSYDSEKHQLNCRFPDGIVREVDPFVGCAIECTDDDYVEKGEACVGKDFIMSGSWRHGPYLCHRFDEIPAPPQTEERG